MVTFLTIDDKIISAVLSDLEVLSYPGTGIRPVPMCRNDTPGQFILRVNRLDYFKAAHLIPDGPTRRFAMAVYEGSPNDKSTWKEVSRFGDCLFDISADRDEWIRFQKDHLLPLPEDSPAIYLLSGRFMEYSAHQDRCGNLEPTFIPLDGPKDNCGYL